MLLMHPLLFHKKFIKIKTLLLALHLRSLSEIMIGTVLDVSPAEDATTVKNSIESSIAVSSIIVMFTHWLKPAPGLKVKSRFRAT